VKGAHQLKYKANSKGLAELARSAKMSAVTVAAAQQVASKANGMDPAGAYKVEAGPIPVGRGNELRAGARVIQTRPSRARNKALRKSI
jgi:hypothetical protein